MMMPIAPVLAGRPALTRSRACRMLTLGCALAAVLMGAADAQTLSVQSLTFQQGVDGYESTVQFRMRANGLTESGLDLVQYYMDGSPFANEADDTVDVVRFGDIFGPGAQQIPLGATILSAQFIYSTGDAADAISGGPYQLGRLLSEVPEGASYLDYPLDPAARRSVRSLTAEPWLAGAASVQALEAIPIDITEVVQAWSSGAANHGVVTFANDSTDGWQVCTISHPETSRRPKLSVSFINGAVRTLEIPANAVGLVSTNGGVVDGTSRVTAMVANAPADPIGLLLRFDEVFGTNATQVGPNERVVGAKLLLQTAGSPDYSAAADSASPFTIHQVLSEWATGSDFGTNGLTVAEGDLAEAADEVVGMGEWTRATAEVTSVLSRWQAGQTNRGIHVKPVGGNGWEVFLTGTTNAVWKPTLRLFTIAYTGNPTAAFITTTREGEAPLTVGFDATGSSDPDGSALAYAWDFGDGTQATGATAQHVFASAGVYNVALKVTDAEGKVGEALVSVRALGSPVVRWTTSWLEGPEPLRLSASAAGSLDPDGGTVEYAWDFGDGTSATGETVQHTYRRGGTFPLLLSITDDEGRRVMATNTVTVQETSVETRIFQEGRDGYAGTFERRVQANGFAQMGRVVPEYYLDGRPQTAAQATNDTCELIRFDNMIGTQAGQIPPKAKIVRATLTFHSGTDVNANTDGPYVLGYLTKPVTETTLYADLDSGSGIAEEAGPRGSVEALLLGGYSDIAVQEVVSADVTPFVQRWVDGETNHGLAIFTDDTTDGWQISTIGHPLIERRPRLEVDYTTGEVSVRRFSLVRSVVAAKAAETLDGSALEVSFLDGGADADYKEGLFLFEDVFGSGQGKVGTDERVLAARMIVRTGGLPESSGDADADDPYSVHTMLRTWDVTSNYGTNGVSVAGGEAGPAVAEFLGMGERTWNAVDILPVVLEWSAGLPNHGLNIKPQGSDGWQIHWGAAADPVRLPVIEVISEKARTQPIETRILTARVTANRDLVVTWNATPGVSYQVEATGDFRTWAVLRPVVAVTGTQAEVSIPLTEWPGNAGFLRVSGVRASTP
jgi:PKD repeat protein